MKRTEYFNYTRPTETQLSWTETSKINAILDRGRSFAQFGVVSGFYITINGSDTTKIDISAGEGYSGGHYTLNSYKGTDSGERIYKVAATTGVTLATYVPGALNYVALEYTETASNQLSERTLPFFPHYTIYNESYTIHVYNSFNWNAADKNTHILIGIVVGHAGALTLSDVTQVIQPKNHPTTSQPVNISGATIMGVTDSTTIGSGTLTYTAGSPKTLQWTAPGDVIGAAIPFTTSGQFTVYSGNTVDYIVVDVVYALVPSTNQTDTIYITSLYGRSIPLASSVDQAHRDLVGTGVVSPTNPHGLSWVDLTGGSTEHDDLLHVNGIVRGADSDQLECTINSDTIEITNNGGTANTFLVEGVMFTLVTGYVAGVPAVIDFDALGITNEGDYMFYLDGTGTPGYVRIAGAAGLGPGSSDVLDASIRVIDMANTTAGNGTLTWDSTNRLMTYAAQGDVAGAAVRIGYNIGTGGSGYYKIFSSTTTNWIIIRLTADPIGAGPWTVTTDMTNVHSEEAILKLGVACWNTSGGGIFTGTIRDIRQWCTSDIRPDFLAEHDADGYHTKVLRNRFNVQVESTGAIVAEADEIAVYGYAIDSNAGYFAAKVKAAVVGVAPNTALYGVAATAAGVYATAASSYAGYFKAPTAAVFGTVTANSAVYGKADASFGGYFTASIYACLGAASAYGVVGNAVNSYGVYGSAPNIGVYGVAYVPTSNATITGAHFQVFNASDSRGVAIFGEAGTGGFAVPYGTAIKASAAAADGTAYFGTAFIGAVITAGRLGAEVLAINSGSAYGVRVAATGSSGLNDVKGLYVTALNTKGGNEEKAVAINGEVTDADATAVYAVATSGTAVYARGLLRYDYATVAAAGATQGMIPIIVAGDTYYLWLYS